MTNPIAEKLQHVRADIDSTARQCGRNPQDICLLAVSKTKPAADLRSAYEAGQRHFGENYLQEALEKIQQLQSLSIVWHFIGAIQSNKTRDIAGNFDWVHTIDRIKVARRLSEQRPPERGPLNVCLQVNIDGEATKAGVAPHEVVALAKQVAELPNLTLRGLMAIPAPRTGAEQGQPFVQMGELQRTLAAQLNLPLDTLSMGMSGDMEQAIRAGSTMVRVGTAIFGARQ